SGGRARCRTIRWPPRPARCWPRTPPWSRPSPRSRRAHRGRSRARPMPVGHGEPPPPIGGICDPRFAPLRDAFVANFTGRGDVGAAVPVSIGGRVVIDLWGGWADASRRRPWQRDTLVNFFSVSKGLSTVCVLQLVERGLLELDETVARYWPAFAAAHK